MAAVSRVRQMLRRRPATTAVDNGPHPDHLSEGWSGTAGHRLPGQPERCCGAVQGASKTGSGSDTARPLRVAVIMPLAEQRGGGELMLWDLLGNARACGVEWIVIFLQDGPLATRVRSLGVDVEVIPAGRLRQPHRVMSGIARVCSVIRRSDVQMILSWMGYGQLYGGVCARLTSTPCMWYQLGTPTTRNCVDRLATILPARAVITLSGAGQKAQQALWPHRATPLVYPGVDLARFDDTVLLPPNDLRTRLGLPARGAIIAIVGRLQRWKGMHVLVEAMPQVLARHPGAHCVIVGGTHPREPEYAAQLRAAASDLGISHSVSLVGLQSNVPEWMQAADVVVHASENEPFGIVIIEAMALGKPVVAGSCGGPAEIISDGVDGLLVQYGRSDLLADAVLRYLDNPQFAAAVSANARVRARAFSTTRYADEVTSAVLRFAGSPSFGYADIGMRPPAE